MITDGNIGNFTLTVDQKPDLPTYFLSQGRQLPGKFLGDNGIRGDATPI